MPQVKSVEAKVRRLEGFAIRILTEDGADVRSDRQLSAQFDGYTNKAPGTLTVAGWRRNRFAPQFPGFDVAICLGNGEDAPGNMLLARVRDTYR
jgi:hypothetical protein